VNTVRQLGYALGIAALGLLYQGDPAPHAALNDTYRASALIGLVAGVLVLAAVRRPAPAPTSR
jgi:hypothetical protein